MERDFTLIVYERLLATLKTSGRRFLTYHDLQSGRSNQDTVVTLRHDVDDRKENSLQFARIQSKEGISGTYYFRMIPQSYDEKVIREMADLGHEIGYHYETMDTSRGNVDKAYSEFCRHLEHLRKIVQVTTICMHGSPLSKFDNRAIWQKYDYRKLGLIAEPYFDIDFNKTYYITDTGRRWDGARVSVRDKAMDTNPCTNPDFINRHYHSTFEIIEAIKNGDFPTQVMMTFHPQRWTNNRSQWLQELIIQNVKNQVKKMIIRH